MSNPETPVQAETAVQSDVDALRAEIDRLNALLQQTTTTPTTEPPATPTTTVRETSSTATIIGAASNPQGGTVVGYSDGTVKLLNAPEGVAPWGSAPVGTYGQFFTDDNGNRYNFVKADGSGVESVENPVQVRP